MMTLDNFLSWVLAFGLTATVVAVIFLANHLRQRFLGIRRNWEDGVLPSIGYLTVHLVWWWMSPETWWQFYQSNGFVLLQMVLVFGIYSATLHSKMMRGVGYGKTPWTVGWILIVLSCLGFTFIGDDS